MQYKCLQLYNNGMFKFYGYTKRFQWNHKPLIYKLIFTKTFQYKNESKIKQSANTQQTSLKKTFLLSIQLRLFRGRKKKNTPCQIITSIYHATIHRIDMVYQKKKKRSRNFEQKKAPPPPPKLVAVIEISEVTSETTVALDKSLGNIAQKNHKLDLLILTCFVGMHIHGVTVESVSLLCKRKKRHSDLGNFILNYRSLKEGTRDNLCCKICTRKKQ